jgi:membrane-associated protease RseP (regulator of RpoE activity)
MKNIFTRGLVAAVVATAIGAGSAAAQVQTKTVQMGSNCVVTVTTSVLTNSGAVSVSGACGTLDPQLIIRALGGADGGTTVSGGTVDLQVIMKIISSITGGNAGGNPQMLIQSLAGAARGAGIGVVTGSAQMSTNPVTWLGLAADEVSADVRAQLPLPEGAGLLVRNVTAGGPAAQAGVWANDILVKLDDQLLVNAAQLHALIRGKKDGDKITLSLLRKGKVMQVLTTLVKKLLPEDDGVRSQVINLGASKLDLSSGFGMMNLAGDTQSVGRINIRAILEAVSNAMQQAQRELNRPAK